MSPSEVLRRWADRRMCVVLSSYRRLLCAGGVSPILGSERAHRSLSQERSRHYRLQSTRISRSQLEETGGSGSARRARPPGDGKQILQVCGPDPSQVHGSTRFLSTMTEPGCYGPFSCGGPITAPYKPQSPLLIPTFLEASSILGWGSAEQHYQTNDPAQTLSMSWVHVQQNRGAGTQNIYDRQLTHFSP